MVQNLFRSLNVDDFFENWEYVFEKYKYDTMDAILYNSRQKSF